MKNILLILFCFLSFKVHAQSLYFPPITGNTWDTLSPTSLNWCVSEIDSLYDYLNQNNTKAFILLKDGKIVLEKYFGTFTQDSVWYWASAGKTIMSFMTGIAQQENYLNINNPTSSYIGTWTIAPSAKEQNIKVKNQLSMTSGLDDGVSDPTCTIDTCLKYLANAGTRWAYHNAPYTLLDTVIESATGQTLNSYINQKLKIPTGMTGLFVKVDFDNVFFSKPRSMARFGLLVLNKGTWNSTPIMTDTSYFNQMINTSQNINNSYGYLWWLNGKSNYMIPSLQTVFNGWLFPNAPADAFAAMGKNGQFLNVVPSKNLVFVRMGEEPSGTLVPFLMNDSIWIKLNKIMCTPNQVSDISSAVQKPTIYPNPANAFITINYPNQKFSLQLCSLIGNVILEKNNCIDHEILSILGLKSGIYLIRITSNEGKIDYLKIEKK